jgi:hypothetical protein
MGGPEPWFLDTEEDKKMKEEEYELKNNELDNEFKKLYLEEKKEVKEYIDYLQFKKSKERNRTICKSIAEFRRLVLKDINTEDIEEKLIHENVYEMDRNFYADIIYEEPFDENIEIVQATYIYEENRLKINKFTILDYMYDAIAKRKGLIKKSTT